MLCKKTEKVDCQLTSFGKASGRRIWVIFILDVKEFKGFVHIEVREGHSRRKNRVSGALFQ
jgi:hypothetical protein